MVFLFLMSWGGSGNITHTGLKLAVLLPQPPSIAIASMWHLTQHGSQLFISAQQLRSARVYWAPWAHSKGGRSVLSGLTGHVCTDVHSKHRPGMWLQLLAGSDTFQTADRQSNSTDWLFRSLDRVCERHRRAECQHPYKTTSRGTFLGTHTSRQAGLVKCFPLKLMQPSQIKMDGVSWGCGWLVGACWVQSLVVETDTYINKSVSISQTWVWWQAWQSLTIPAFRRLRQKKVVWGQSGLHNKPVLQRNKRPSTKTNLGCNRIVKTSKSS